MTSNLRDVLIEEGRAIEHVWFMEEGLGSVIAVCQDNEQVEVAHVGPEGMAGKTVVLGVDHSNNRTLMQVAGIGMRSARISTARSAEPKLDLASFLLRYVHVALTQLSQTALANGRYNLQERLARWLLMCNDRLHIDEMPLTHEFLSLMLGVRRSGVTEAIHLLEGFTSSRRRGVRFASSIAPVSWRSRAGVMDCPRPSMIGSLEINASATFDVRRGRTESARRAVRRNP